MGPEKPPRVFQLGKFQFQLFAADQKIAQFVGDAFELSAEQNLNAETVCLDELSLLEDPSLSGEELGSSLIDRVIDLSYEKHLGFAYLDAAFLLGASGRLHLLAGSSFAGKTSTSLSLCLAKGWKLLSEDISYIEFPAGDLCSVVAPLSIREPTLELIQKQFLLKPKSLIANRWLKCPELHLNQDAFNLRDMQNIFLLSEISYPEQGKLQVTELSHELCLRRLLPLSNLLRLDNVVSSFMDMIQGANCFLVSGGSLKERVEFLNSLD